MHMHDMLTEKENLIDALDYQYIMQNECMKFLKTNEK